MDLLLIWPKILFCNKNGLAYYFTLKERFLSIFIYTEWMQKWFFIFVTVPWAHCPNKNEPLGSVYSKRQRQCCDNSAMMLAISFSLKLAKSLENRLQPHSGATPLFSMRMESQASSQSCRSIDADIWYKWAISDCDLSSTMEGYHWFRRSSGNQLVNRIIQTTF